VNDRSSRDVAGLRSAVSAAAFRAIGTAFSNTAAANIEAVNGGSKIQLLKSGLTSGQTIAKIAAHAGAGNPKSGTKSGTPIKLPRSPGHPSNCRSPGKVRDTHQIVGEVRDTHQIAAKSGTPIKLSESK